VRQLLRGRHNERDRLTRLVLHARRGDGGALVVHGEPGVGKSALIDFAVDSDDDVRVLRTVGSETEVELPFAALQQLCASVLERINDLPEPQRRALGVAFGLANGEPPDRLLVGLAILTLFSELAAERPVVIVIDDAQWLDQASAQAVAFVARRVANARVAFIFGARVITDELRGLAELELLGLNDNDARELLASALPHRLDERVLGRIVAETHGNPLALLELPRGLSPARLAGGFGLPISASLTDRIESSFRRRIRQLPPLSRRLLLIASADPTGDPALVWRAAERLDIPESAANSVEAAELFDLSAGIVFRHPLARSAAYSAASAYERRQAHQSLGDVTDPAADPDRRAWHRAQAIASPEESVAEEMERSAERAQRRGGFAAAAAFMERATELTGDVTLKAGRALRAAEAKRQAGAFDAALGLAAIAERGPLDDSQYAQLEVLRGQIAFASERGSEAPQLLLAAAERLQRVDVKRASETYLEALTAAVFAGRLSKGANALDVARAAERSWSHHGEPRASELLLAGLASLIVDGAAAGTPALKRALRRFRDDEVSTDERVRWLWLAGRGAGYIWDYETWDLLTARQVQVARDSGALAVLPLTLSTRAGVHLFRGELAVASSLVEQVESVVDVIDSRTVPYAALAVAAFRGRAADAQPLIDATRRDFLTRGEGMGVTLSYWATATLYNGLGRYEEALAAAEEALADLDELWFSPWAMIEFIEAASRTERATAAERILERLASSTSASGTDWAKAIEARSRALLRRGSTAEMLYREAIDRLAPTPLRWDLARTHLVYGEWLRRERRRRDARDHLRIADQLFTEFNAEGFRDRARVELRATGERSRERTSATGSDLTPQEAQISRLVAQGASNREIAAELFISPSTVEYHLHKMFLKLGVKSRTQLANRVRESGRTPG
jgi:DNA-binding CsgD family transcriptional regulator